jgi:hypothetical protein
LLLRELAIPYRDWDEAGDLELLPLAESGCLRNLRNLHLGTPDDQCHIEGPDLHLLAAELPRLEELRIFAHQVDTAELFKVPMPNLRTLYVYHLREYPLEVLAKNKSLAQLETLSLWPHALEPDDNAAYITAERFIALVRSRHLPALRHLEVFNSDLGDAGCEAIVKSGILKRLKVLDIARGRVTDDGARTLAACPDFKNLERFGIDQNMLTDIGLDALLDTDVAIHSTRQYDETRMYDLEYLGEGDIE